MVKKLRYYARFIVVCLLLKKMKLVRDLVRVSDLVRVHDLVRVRACGTTKNLSFGSDKWP